MNLRYRYVLFTKNGQQIWAVFIVNVTVCYLFPFIIRASIVFHLILHVDEFIMLVISTNMF